MLQRAHQLGSLRLIGIVAALLALAAAVVWALAKESGSESTSGPARNPAATESAHAPRSAADEGANDAHGVRDSDPGRKDRAGDREAQATGSEGGAGQKKLPSSEAEKSQGLEDLPRAGPGDPDRVGSQPELPPKVAKLLLGGGQMPSDLPPELRGLLPEGTATGR
jgi:hypothetical protein